MCPPGESKTHNKSPVYSFAPCTCFSTTASKGSRISNLVMPSWSHVQHASLSGYEMGFILMLQNDCGLVDTVMWLRQRGVHLHQGGVGVS